GVPHRRGARELEPALRAGRGEPGNADGDAANVTARTTMPAIAMGALGVAQGDQVLRTLLGSCLGLALYDRRLKLGGLAHIVLPKAPAGPCELPGKFVDTAVPALMRKMEALSDGTALKLWAKIAGGANMFSSPTTNT